MTRCTWLDDDDAMSSGEARRPGNESIDFLSVSFFGHIYPGSSSMVGCIRNCLRAADGGTLGRPWDDGYDDGEIPRLGSKHPLRSPLNRGNCAADGAGRDGLRRQALR
jgi:hypothetical protein